MNEYEIKKETEAFQIGYWDAFRNEDNFPHNPKPSERIDYHRGYREGLNDIRRGT